MPPPPSGPVHCYSAAVPAGDNMLLQRAPRMWLTLVLLLPAAAQGFGYGWIRNNQSVVYGHPAPWDRLLYQDMALLGAKRGQSVVYNLQYPMYSMANFGERITCIKIIDQWLNGTNGNVFLHGGGVGEKFVSLSIRSVLNHGLGYLIYLYGRKF